MGAAEILPIIIYVLLIILLFALIILCVKCIKVVNRAEKMLKDIEEKVNKFNKIFEIFDTVNGYVSLLSDRIVKSVKKIVSKFLNRKSEKMVEEEELETILKERGDYDE